MTFIDIRRLSVLAALVLCPALESVATAQDPEATSVDPSPSVSPSVDATDGPSSVPPTAAVSSPTPLEPEPGRVVGHRGNDAIIDRGTSNGVSLGAIVRLYALVPVDLGDGEIAHERQAIGTGRVVALTERRCLVALGSNEEAPIGAYASLAPGDVPSASVLNPPRVGGVWEIGATARVFEVTSALGGGFVGDGYVAYRGERPFFVRARLDPSGFTMHRTDRDDPFHSATAASGIVLAGVDHRYFAFGAGFGITRVLPTRAKVCTYDYGTLVSCDDEFEGAHAGFTFGLHGRLGPADGFSVTADVGFTSVRRRSEIGHLELRALVPVTQTLAFSLRGGSGFQVTGASWIDIGARMRARGDGGSGTLFVTPFLGWARLSQRQTLDYAVYTSGSNYDPDDGRLQGKRGGASAGVGIDYRF